MPLGKILNAISQFGAKSVPVRVVLVVVLPDPSEEWGCGRTPRRPNSQVTLQGLDQRSSTFRQFLQILRPSNFLLVGWFL